MELKLKNANSFIIEINEMVKSGNYESYIEAIVSYCEKNNMDVETAASLLKGSGAIKIKSKIQEEGESIHLLPKTNRIV
jgi:hypothetical protein